MPHVPCALRALVPHMPCALCASRALYLAYSLPQVPCTSFWNWGLNIKNDFSHFSETDFSMIYLIHLKLVFCFNPFKGTLARNRFKSFTLTTSKVLRNSYWVSSILNFDTWVDQSAFFKDLFLTILQKIVFFVIVYFCAMKLLEIAKGLKLLL